MAQPAALALCFTIVVSRDVEELSADFFIAYALASNWDGETDVLFVIKVAQVRGLVSHTLHVLMLFSGC